MNNAEKFSALNRFDYLVKNTKVVPMETKSRYEVIAELEEKKRSMMFERDSQDNIARQKEVQIKQLKRQLEDAEDELFEIKKNKEVRIQTLQALVDSIDDSLKRLSSIDSSSRKK